MSPAVREENRRRIRHLYFVQRVAPVAIAEELRLSLRTVRRALVIRGGAARTPPAGPYRPPTPRATVPTSSPDVGGKETDS